MSTLSSKSIFSNDYWKVCVASVSYETTVSAFLWAISGTKKNGIYGLYKGSGVTRQRYSQLITGKSRPGTDLLHELAKSPQFKSEEKKLLLKLENTPDARKKFISNVIMENFPSKPKSAVDYEIKKAGQISCAAWTKIQDGCLCNPASLLRLIVGLHCNRQQTQALIKLHGYDAINGDFVQFLRKKVEEERCYDLHRILDDYWAISQGKAA